MRLCLYHALPKLDLYSLSRKPDLVFGGSVRLRDLNLYWRDGGTASLDADVTSRPGELLFIHLTWEGLAPIEKRYKVSIQLADGQGRLLKQTDREPLDGFRPTNSWKEHEVISDRYAFRLPVPLHPGVYQLGLVLYDSETGNRLFTDSDDLVNLANIKVSPG